MRSHGLQPPYDVLQIIAVSTFASLSVVFYVFLAPFMGKNKYELFAFGFYTPLVMSVLFLYISCSSINPADPCIMKPKKDAVLNIAHLSSDKQSSEAGVFYCKLCESEVSKQSKHCRVCDKCVCGFDHHCRWLNTCIGRKNYWCFILLMASSLLLLLLQLFVGIVVLVRSSVELNRFKQEIEANLGKSFTFIPFIVIIVLSSIMVIAATISLTQLFLFHFILLIKGITTYDYIIAMREKNATENSPIGDSSSSTLNPTGWCSPPPPHWFGNDEFVSIGEEDLIGGDVSSSNSSRSSSKVRTESKLRQKVPKWKKSAGNKKNARFYNRRHLRRFHSNNHNVGISTSQVTVVAATPVVAGEYSVYDDDDDGNRKEVVLQSRSSTDGYEASGGEDSDRIPTRIIHRYSDWSSFVLNKSNTLLHITAAGDPSFSN